MQARPPPKANNFIAAAAKFNQHLNLQASAAPVQNFNPLLDFQQIRD